jgi:hypothetical protein
MKPIQTWITGILIMIPFAYALSQPPGRPANVSAAQQVVNTTQGEISALGATIEAEQKALNIGLVSPAERAALTTAITQHNLEMKQKYAAQFAASQTVRDWQNNGLKMVPGGPSTKLRWQVAKSTQVLYHHTTAAGKTNTMAFPVYSLEYGTQIPQQAPTSSYGEVNTTKDGMELHIRKTIAPVASGETVLVSFQVP